MKTMNQSKDTQVRISLSVYKIIQEWAKKDGRTIKAQQERMIMSSHAVLKDMERANARLQK